MNGAPSTARAVPQSLPRMSLPVWASPRDLAALLRLLAFAGLAAYVAAGWLAIIADPPTGRAVLAVLASLAGAAVLSWLGGDRLSRRATWTLAAAKNTAIQDHRARLAR